MRDGRAVPPVGAPAPGVWSVPAALPRSALGYSLLYLLEHPDGLAVIDAGVDNEPTRAALAEGLALAGGELADVTDVLLTHHHPDHTGLAEHIRAASGACIAIGAGDAAALREPFGAFVDRFARELELAGVPADEHARMLDETYASAAAANTTGIEPDANLNGVRPRLGSLEVIDVPGHTRGHVALFDRARGLLFCGDALLPSGTIQLDVVSEPEDDPLSDLLRSLTTLERLGAELALPGHGAPFGDIGAVAAEQRRRQLERRDRVAALLRVEPGLTAWEASARLSRRDWGTVSVVGRRYATMETAAVMRGLGALAQPAR